MVESMAMMSRCYLNNECNAVDVHGVERRVGHDHRLFFIMNIRF